MNELVIKTDDYLDVKFMAAYYKTEQTWILFLSSLDRNIKEVTYDVYKDQTIIKFNNSADKTWFLLRWS